MENGFINTELDDAAIELETAIYECIRDTDGDSLYELGNMILGYENPSVVKFGNLLRAVKR